MSTRGRGIVALLALGLVVPALVAAPTLMMPARTAVTIPGNSGTPQAGTVAFAEDFGNGVATNPISLLSYTGPASAQNVSYTADPYWATAQACNGFVLQSTTVNNTACPNGGNSTRPCRAWL